MQIPKYNEMYKPLLEAIKDGRVYDIKDVKSRAAKILKLDEAALSEMIHSGIRTVFEDRLGWAKTYLKKAGLITSPHKGYIQITDEGKKLLKSNEPITNELLSKKYPSFAEWFNRPSKTSQGKTNTNETSQSETESDETPQETMGRAYKEINSKLADDLLEEIMKQSPSFFEQLVVDLMKAMNYGDGLKTKTSGDGGIDGIIPEDKLGFSLIYIQAKCWDRDMTISRPEIQKFAGAMLGPPKVEKGLFITTAKFSPSAREFADAQHIILIDGQRLAELMIEHNLGVSVQSTFSIKRIDSNYFDEDL